MSKLAVERQTVVTWNRPTESLPEEGVFVVVSISGHSRNIKWDHALAIAEYWDEEGWIIDSIDPDLIFNRFTVHAWADLAPYEGD